MKKLLGIIALVCAFYASGCGGNAVKVSLTPSAAEAIDDGQTVNITATVTNDATNKGVSWTLSGPGSLTNATTASVTYNAPATGSGSATITAASVADATRTSSVTINVTPAPSITTVSLPSGIIGTTYSQQIAETGGAGTLTYSHTGSLPAGLSLNTSTGAITGTPTGPVGTSNFTITVTDSSAAGAKSATSGPLSITINQAPAITSATSTTFVVGTPGTFSVTSTGTPTPSLTETGALPTGVTFVDNGNGTATLSGTPASGTAANYPITITANNGVGTPATQSFTLTVGQAPTISSATSATFTVGTAGTFSVTTTGFPAPSLTETGALPSGVTFKDNGNGTATLSGNAATGTGGTYPISIKAHNGIGTDATQSFTLTVDEGAAVTSANKATFVVSTPGTFSVTTTGYPKPALTETGALPTGVTFVDNGNGTATLSGTAASGTANNYPITITATNGVGTPATQSFTLTVGQAPAITSASSTTFTVSSAGTFSVTTTGFPKPALTETGALPSGVTFVDNGNGTATLSGTPATGTGNTYSITITANNGVGSNATQTFALTVDEAAAVTSASSTTFSVGAAGTFSVTTTGYPKPALTETGALPTGVSFTDSGNGTATLSGTPGAGTNGTYKITITATNGVGTPATQSFTLTVDTAPVITSANNTTFTVGAPGTFSVTTTGTPTPSLSDGGATLPSGVTFVDNGNGTATLAGTPGAGTGGVYHFTITASNGVGSAGTQSFTLTVDQAPAITSLASTTFTVGTSSSFSVQTTGVPNPVLTETGALPSGVTFVDNGNGTATLSGTPASGTSGTYPLVITANNGIGTPATQNFTLTVDTAPVFTSGTSATFTVGTGGTFTITTTGSPTPTLSISSGTLPSGVTFTDNGNGTGTLNGTPASGTGGSYPITIKAQSTSGSTTQNFTLTVNQVPAITSNSSATFTLGQSGTFTVTTSGFPAPSLSDGGATLPSGVTFVDNGNGTGTLSGTPATGTAGTYNITFTATNTVGSSAPQSFTLTVISDPCASFSGGSESLLTGNYAFLLKGFDNGQFTGENGQAEPALVGGVLAFNGTNGSGSITSGAIDLNLNGTAGLDSLTVSSGTYKVGSSHRGCMALNLSDGTTEHYAFSLGNISSNVASTGHMISFDSSSSTGTVFATGTLKKQDTTAFSTSKVTGNYAFLIASTQNTARSGSTFGAAGIIKLSSGSVTGGEADSNDAGGIDKDCGANLTAWPTTPCYSISSGGTYTIGSNGRGSVTFTVGVGGNTNTVNMEIYVVSATDFFVLQNVDQTLDSVSAGEALQQSGSFSKSTLNGTVILYQSGFDCGGSNCTINQSNPTGQAGSNINLVRATANGSGSISGTFYGSSSGTIQTQSFSGFTYTVDSNGRAIISGTGVSPLLLYLSSSNHAWELGSDNGVGTGALEPQTTTSVSGAYAFGGLNPPVPGGVGEGVATFASGNVSGTQDHNDSQNGPQAGGSISGTVSVDSTGFGQVASSGTCTPTSGNCQFLFYVISPNRIVGMDGSSTNSTLQPADQ